METDLRLILLGVGLLVVGGIILDGMRRRRKTQYKEKMEAFAETVMESASEQHDPLLEGYFSKQAQAKPKAPVMPHAEDALSFEQDIAPASLSEPEVIDFNDNPDEILALTILPRQGRGFSGRALMSALQAAQMQLGAKQIFHRYHFEDDEYAIAFSLASLTEPGTMPLENFNQAVFPGLMIFMVLPGPKDPLITFETMMTTARQLSGTLVGELCDYKRSHLTIQTIEQYREQIRDYMRRSLAAQQKEML